MPRRADKHRLFTNAIPLLFDTEGLICCLSALDRFPSPQTTWSPGTPPRRRILMPLLVRTSDQHNTVKARAPDRIQSYNSSLQVAGLQESAASPSESLSFDFAIQIGCEYIRVDEWAMNNRVRTNLTFAFRVKVRFTKGMAFFGFVLQRGYLIGK